MLRSVGKEELLNIIREDHGAELTCHFCHTTHRFNEDELKALLNSDLQ